MNSDTLASHWHILPPPSTQVDWTLYPFDSNLVVARPASPVADTSIAVNPMPKVDEIRFEGKRRFDANSDWLLIPLIIALLLITFSRALYFRRFSQIFSSVVSSNNMNIMLREGNVLGEVVSVLLFGNFLLMLGLTVYLSAMNLGVNPLPDRLPDYFLFAGIILGLILFIFFKVLMIQITGSVFRTGEESGEYVLNTYLFNYIIGVLIMPLVILSIYPGLEWALKLTWLIVSLLYIIRVGRGVMIGIRNVKFSPLLFLLYLCTLEILPLVIIIKLVISKG